MYDKIVTSWTTLVWWPGGDPEFFPTKVEVEIMKTAKTADHGTQAISVTTDEATPAAAKSGLVLDLVVRFQRKDDTLANHFAALKDSRKLKTFPTIAELQRAAEKGVHALEVNRALTLQQVEALYFTAAVADIDQLRERGEITERTRYGRTYRLRRLLLDTRSS